MRDRKTLEEITAALLQQGESTEEIAIELLLDLREQNDNLAVTLVSICEVLTRQIEIERDAVLQAGGIRIAGA
jgi:hypothetical protein